MSLIQSYVSAIGMVFPNCPLQYAPETALKYRRKLDPRFETEGGIRFRIKVQGRTYKICFSGVESTAETILLLTDFAQSIYTTASGVPEGQE